MPNLLDSETVDRKLVFGQALFGLLKSSKMDFVRRLIVSVLQTVKTSSASSRFFMRLQKEREAHTEIPACASRKSWMR